MKKFALSILSVLIILGGVFLSACEKKVSLSVSAEEIVIYTNDEQEENYLTKDIDVSVENSSGGINVEVLKGQDSVSLSKVRKKDNGNFSFTIYGNKSGQSEVRVSALDDPKQSKIINVQVNTVLEELKASKNDDENARSNLFVIKGDEQGKSLKAEDFFAFEPVTANISDVVWSFEDAEEDNAQQILKDGNVVAYIENGKLFVLDAYEFTYVNLRASFVRNLSINANVRFEVLQKATINKFEIDDGDDTYQIYENSNYTFNLIRNDSYRSFVTSKIEVNSPYEMKVSPVLWQEGEDGSLKELEKSEYEKYVICDIIPKGAVTGSQNLVYELKIDALDIDKLYEFFGKIYLTLRIGYKDYLFDFETKATIALNTYYTAESIEVLDDNNYTLNNGEIDVFSSYTVGNGRKLKVNIKPSEVAIDNELYYISIDINQFDDPSITQVSDFARFYCRGQELLFVNEPGSTVFTCASPYLKNGVDLYVASAEKFEMLEDVNVTFIALGNAVASTNLIMNFYKISDDADLDVKKADGEELDAVSYISSSLASERKRTFEIRFNGISKLAGIELKTDDNKDFVFSKELEYVSSNVGGVEGTYLIAKFDVELNGYNFDSTTKFWFEHVTGKVSSKYSIESFVPMQSAYIQNANKSSSDVYIDQSNSQNFLDVEGLLVFDDSKASNSVSKLSLEAGISLPLVTNYQNATLTADGIVYKYLSYEKLVEEIQNIKGVELEEAKEIAEEIFVNGNVAEVVREYYRAFDADFSEFSITQEGLSLTDNAFKGFVCVLFEGWNEDHTDNVTLVRVFALESFYSVRHLAPNVKTKLLYTAETLSLNDMGRSEVDVNISMRLDDKVPSDLSKENYLSKFDFISSKLDKLNDENSLSILLQNKYYDISDISLVAGGKQLKFKITAKSTNMQTVFNDILTIVYNDDRGFKRETEIQIEIRNEKRIESVQWLNQTEDSEIYLNLTTTVSSERSFTISTSVLPSDANNIGLTHKYFALSGSENDLSIATSSVGQTFNLNINTTKGGYGLLYLLPNDMVKIVDGTKHFLAYKYSEDEDGNLKEETVTKKLSELNNYYEDLISGNGEFSEYFYNNDGEKVYYQDIIIKIKIVIADGLSEGTAIRVYNEADLKAIDYAKYYRIMNNITLHNWESCENFSGMFFGKDELVTLTFSDGSENFIRNLTGTVKDLVFAGQVATNDGGFVVDVNNGTLENVSVDVYYDSNEYKGSKLTSYASRVGVLAGENNGMIKNCFAYGVSINATSSVNTGGITGINNGTISGSGVEFYEFGDPTNSVKNKFVTGGAVGGIVGFAGEKSLIEKSYVYAYSLANKDDFDVSTIISNGNKHIGAFMGGHNNGATVVESFAFMGSLNLPMNSSDNGSKARFTNSYISYYSGADKKINTRIFVDENINCFNSTYSNGYSLTEGDIPADYTNAETYNATWTTVYDLLKTNTKWEVDNIQKTTNFGIFHLKEVTQSSAVDLNNVKVQSSIKGQPLKVLSVGEDQDKGILFVYKTIQNVVSASEKASLENYNTISIADLFGVDEKQARSLLLTTDSRSISIGTNSIKILSKNVSEFTISVHSKMDFTQYKDFKFIVMNYLPELETTLNKVVLNNNQTVLLQTGRDNARTLMYQMNNMIYLNGVGYATEKDEFSVEFNFVENRQNAELKDYVKVSSNSNSLTLIGNVSHEGSVITKITSCISLKELTGDYAEAIKEARTRDFAVSVYNGASGLAIKDATTLEVTPSDYAVFDVILETDDENDDLVFGLEYGQIQVEMVSSSDSFIRFKLNDQLSLDFTWAKERIGQTDEYSFRVVIKIAEKVKHLLKEEYDLLVSVNAKSQQSNDKYTKTIGLAVRTQEIENIEIATYKIESRQIRNSTLYLRASDTITNTLVPSSDAIVMVQIDPVFAKMTHFTLTYTTISTGNVGTVNISRLLHNSLYGYYTKSDGTSLIENGLKVNLLENDKTGNGVFYFRIFVSSTFQSNSGLKLTLTCYDEGESLVDASSDLNVSFLPEANIKVNGESMYVLSKGSSATVTVTVGLDQELDDIYLQNNGANISLYQTSKEPQLFENYKVYTATVQAYVDATLSNGEDTGIFYVYASVRRYINNMPEIKLSRATICLVDFSVDGDGIKVNSSGGTSTYNNKSYDVFYSYIGATNQLRFDYPVLPERYEYDSNNAFEVEAINEIMQKRAEFEENHYYKDEEVGYYINHIYNERTGNYDALTLEQQLYYADNEEVCYSIVNNYGIVSRSMFTIQRNTVEVNGVQKSYLDITGLRTGKQLMKLRTSIIYQGIEMYYDYYFLVVVDVWSDEDTPTQIFTARELIDYATVSELADDYILMNDIVLNDYTPLNTDLIKSLDGNGYTIHLNSFAMPSGNNLDLALFNSVLEGTTLKNVRVNIYNGGQITVDISQYNNINIAGFTIRNYGVIYNCEVVSYYDEEYQKTTVAGENGIVVNYVNGIGTDPIEISESTTTSANIQTTVSGFVGANYSSVTNSRVGGESFRHIVEIAGVDYVKTQNLGTFVIRGQGEVAGFVNINEGTGYVSASFVDNAQIYNKMDSITSVTSGFVNYNRNKIQNSYVEGKEGKIADGEDRNYYNDETNISSIGVIAGFVYENSAMIKNSYTNIALNNSRSKASSVAGFVYINQIGATVSLCYSGCKIEKTDTAQMFFSGVSDALESLNQGQITLSYYYNETRGETTAQIRQTSGVIGVTDIDDEDSFYGFSFASEDEDSYDGIWRITERGITLVSANQIALSNRYSVTTNNNTYLFYSKNIIDADNMRTVDLSYGSRYNPIIIRNAYDFAVATDKAGPKEISSYKEYYNDEAVFGHYRIVNNINMSEIDQNSENENSIKLGTTDKVFRNGLLDGNGFTIENINLGSRQIAENFGLFAKLENAVVMNLDLIVDSIHNNQANIVGTIAGTAVDSSILAISLSPISQENSVNKTSILGNNIVGGVVGMLFGNSRLSDIDVKDIDIYSAYYKKDKTVGSNDNYVGKTLRNLVSQKASIIERVAGLSYAGAIVGYLDIYEKVADEHVQYSSSLEISDYNVVTVHVSDSVNIYGEVAGGLFGYVGYSTLIYDATIELDAVMSLLKPSYIISKNLYSGGLVGENYGGLFAVSASYTKDLQKTIEEGENGYYSGKSGAEKGQQSIFSYTQDDEEFVSNFNAPLYIGGLVGYMGGGYIDTGYNKLNVIVNERDDNDLKNTTVGGIIGMAGVQDTDIDLPFASGSPKVNIYLNEVYSSGNVYNANLDGDGVSAGIIGALEYKTDSTKGERTSIVAMKNVVAVNYLTFNETKLDGDNVDMSASNIEIDSRSVSDKHFVLIGKVVSTTKDVDANNNLVSSIYLINSENIVFDAKSTYKTYIPETGSSTVGGYTTVKAGANCVQINPFGCSIEDVTDSAAYKNSYYKDVVLSVDHIGQDYMSTMASAYARLYNYFLPIGWDSEYWLHTENELFPHIELTPKLDVMFWDNHEDSTYNVLTKMKEDPSITIVLRGRKTADETDTNYGDIDLTKLLGSIATKYPDFRLDISEFSGKLVSYYQYMNSELAGNITEGQQDPNGNGGKVGDRVGIILNQSLFSGLGKGASFEDIRLYYVKNGNEGDGTHSYSFVNGRVEEADFRNITITINQSLTLKTGNEAKGNSTGLLAPYVASTTMRNVNVVFRKNGEDVPELTVEHTSGTNDDVYMGILAGYIGQTSSHRQVNIDSVNFVVKEKKGYEYVTVKDALININFEVASGVVPTDGKGVYMGLYAGLMEKTGGAKMAVGLSNVGNVRLNINKKGKIGLTNVYVGAFAGQAKDITSITFKSSSENIDSSLEIRQYSTIDNFNAGLAFGIVDGSDVENNADENTKFKGKIYQVDMVDSEGELETATTTKTANLGGFAGKISSKSSIKGLSVEFNVAKISVYDAGNNSITETLPSYTDDDNDLFELSLYEYQSYVDLALSPYIITDNNSAIGGYFGYASSGSDIILSGNCDISGVIDVQMEGDEGNIAIGGLIGKTEGSVAGSLITVDNQLDISIRDAEDCDSQAYVGGIIGLVQSKYAVNIIGSGDCINITGNVLSNVKELTYGGAIGHIEEVGTLSISKVVYGGAVRIYGTVGGSYDFPSEVVAGGIVGGFDTVVTSATIDSCLSYGDVFVNYLPKNGATSLNAKLSSYNFGGIVGIAPTSESLTVSKCDAMMTSFNDRLVKDAGYSYTNAIVGKNSGSDNVTYIGNTYSSGVALAYQEETENTDIGYGSSGFLGYTSDVSDATAQNDDILDKVQSFTLKIDGAKTDRTKLGVGHKLNPKELSSVEDISTLTGHYHGISWVAIAGEFEAGGSIADKLTNVAVVGNGHTITRNDEDQATVPSVDGGVANGGLVDSLGSAYSDNNKTPNFNVISGLILDLNITEEDYNCTSGFTYFGGVVGATYGHSFIYGVGVKGRLSVGGTNTDLILAGMVGSMHTGMINQCYVDADITYRASGGGNLVGIAWMEAENNSIIATYSSGLLETYVDNQIYTFARSGNNKLAETRSEVIDCYSISQVKQNNIDGVSNDNQVYFGNVLDVNDSNKSGLSILGTVINASFGVKEDFNNYGSDSMTESDINDISLVYNSTVRCGWNSMYAPADDNSAPEESKICHTKWYFNPLVNYGYASHGFGYLKNVTTYTRVLNMNEDISIKATDEEGNTLKYSNGTDVYTIKEYEYTALNYSEVVGGWDNSKQWFLGIPNQGKFKQMYASIPTNDYTSNFRFVLRYDFDVDTGSIGRDVGTTDKDLILDGNNRTLSLKNTTTTSGLFGTFIGTIENLRVVDANVDAEANVGIVATELQGNITNVSVVGELQSSDTIVGGVVGTLTGNATNVDSAVYINTSGTGVKAGGVIGKLVNVGTNTSNLVVSYSSFSGQIINQKGTYAGGIVGYAEGTANYSVVISQSYNAGSVLAGYTTDTSADFYAGGIVGYAKGVENEKIKISNCYNVGLVGAGNYTTTSEVYAGGIIGSGSEITISSCQNDGPVQAIGKSPNTDEKNKNYTLTSEICDANGNKTKEAGYEIDGDGNITKEPTGSTGYDASPNDLYVKVTLTYNPGSARQVFAYGIGYLASGSISGSESSTDNIKNDGNIGEIQVSRIIKFDRNAMLDNSNDDGNTALDYEGKFELDGGSSPTIYINGYDSYGFPTRVYIKDKMTRNYVGGVTWGSWFSDKMQTWYEKGRDWLSSQARFIANRDNNNTAWEFVGIKGSQSSTSKEGATTYYSSGTFDVSYSDILKGKEYYTLYNSDGAGSSAITSLDLVGAEDSKNDDLAIENEINWINTKKENGKTLNTIKVNGNPVAVVENSSNLKAAVSAKSESVVFTIELPEGFGYDITVNSGDIKITDSYLQYYDITKIEIEKDGNNFAKKVLVTATLYYSKINTDSAGASCEITYEIVEDRIVLSKNNVHDNGDYYIVSFDKSIAAKNAVLIGIKINQRDVPIENCIDTRFGTGLVIVDESIVGLYLQEDYVTSLGELNGKQLEVSFEFYVDASKDSQIYIDSKTGKIDKNVVNFSALKLEEKDRTITFRDYNKTTYGILMDGVTSGDDSINVSPSDDSTYGHISLAGIQGSALGDGNFSFGTGEFGIYYNGSSLTMYENNVKIEDGDSYTYTFGGVEYEFKKENNDIKITGSSGSPTFYDFITGHVYGWECYYIKPVPRSDKYIDEKIEYGHGAISNDDFSLTISAVINAKNENFNRDGTYDGNNSDFASESDVSETKYFGLAVHEKTVVFDYVNRFEFTYVGSDPVGYTVEAINGEELKYLKQGDLNINESFSIDAEAGDIDEIQYTLYTDRTLLKNNNDGAINKMYISDSLNIDTVDEYDNNDYPVGDYLKGYEIFKGNGYVETSYIEEYDGEDTKEEQKGYTYRIYDDGKIEVEYFYLTEIGDTETTNKFKFVCENGALRWWKNTGEKEVVDPDPDVANDEYQVDVWAEQTEGITLDVFRSYEIVNGQTITVDVVVSGLSENAINFAHFNVGDDIKKKFINSYSYVKPKSPRDIKHVYINLIEGKGEHLTVDEENVLSGTFKYRKYESGDIDDKTTWEDAGDWMSLKSPYVINVADNGHERYGYTFKGSVNSSSVARLEENVADVEFKHIVLERDINLNTGFVSNSQNYIGNNHNIRYISSSNSTELFGTNSSMIKDLNVIGISSLKEATSGNNYSMFAKNSSSRNTIVSNVNVYGTIRNVSTVEIGVNSTMGGVESSLASIKDYKNYVSVVGLDADTKGESVESTIKEEITLQSGDSYVSYNILIAGDGGDGMNGNDGVDAGESGKNGGNGGAGGDVKIGVSEDGLVNSLARAGIAGLGGFGGNGQHGTFDGTRAQGGGGGGAAGAMGVHGSKDDADLTNRSDQLDSITRFGGNGGVGGLGRLDGNNNVYYTSGGGGGAGSIAGAGYGGTPGETAAKWYQESVYEKRGLYGYGFLADDYYFNYLGRQYTTSYSWLHLSNRKEQSGETKTAWRQAIMDLWSNKSTGVPEEGDDVFEGFNDDVRNERGGTGGKGGSGLSNGDGKTVFVKYVYVDIQIRTKKRSYGLHEKCIYRCMWTSGETINSSGEAGYGSDAAYTPPAS